MEILNIINEIIKDDTRLNNNIDFEWYRDNELQEDTTMDEFIEYIQKRISEQEIVYYSKAMEFLTDNDTSLRDSIELAIDCGYELKNINSELLATLLFQNMLKEEFKQFLK